MAGDVLANWVGPVAFEDEETGDGRTFKAGALTWQLPMPLRWAEHDVGGHDGAKSVGWVTEVVREGLAIMGRGTVFDEEFAEYLDTAGQVGVSIDVDTADIEMLIPPDPEVVDGENWDEKMLFLNARMRAVTAVDIPAFINAVITLDESVVTTAPAEEPAILAATEQPSEAVTHSGIAVVATDTGRVLLQQRALDDEDPEQGLWEFPGGGLEPGETPEEGALREFAEETGLVMPPGVTCSREWQTGVYMGHVYRMEEGDLNLNPDVVNRDVDNPDLEMQGGIPETHAWFHCDSLPPLRTELTDFDWSILEMPEPEDTETQLPQQAGELALAEELLPVEEAPAEAEPAALSDADTSFLNTVLEAHQQMLGPVEEYLMSSGTNDEVSAWAEGLMATLTQCISMIDSWLAPVPDEMDAMVASAAPVAPPDEWFEPFDLEGPTPITVTKDGRVFGHVATWGSCHADFNGQCVRPPSDPDAPLFHLGEVITASGQPIAVGRLTVGGGHAPKGMKARAALEHYDNVSTCVAVVRAQEDQYGIGLFGSVVPEATPEQIAALRRSPLSGDWRKERGKWRLTAAHAVNNPAFTIVRDRDTHALVASSTPESFITTGRVEKRYGTPMDVNLEPARKVLVDAMTGVRRADLAARIAE